MVDRERLWDAFQVDKVEGLVVAEKEKDRKAKGRRTVKAKVKKQEVFRKEADAVTEGGEKSVISRYMYKKTTDDS